MCTNPKYITVEPTPYERLKGVVSPYQIPVPCGKCFDCLSHRQNSFMFRAYREANQYGNVWHLTLTYKEDKLPMAKSLWRVDLDTGELFRKYDPESISKCLTCVSSYSVPRYHKRTKRPLKPKVVRRYEFTSDSYLRNDVLSMVCSGIPRLASSSLDTFGLSSRYGYEYFETPSFDVHDIQAFLKYCKTEFGRRFFNVENLRYLITPEYGEKGTRRPHYHCMLINCPEQFAYFLKSVWSQGYVKHFKNGNSKKYFGYGRTTLQRVNMYCKKYRGNGFKNVASYLSKYTCKGIMDNPAALQGFTKKMRVLTSKNFGGYISEDERKYYLALDLYDYNPEDISGLPRLTIDKIVQVIISRLHFTLPDCYDRKTGKPFEYSLPERFLKSIFGFRLCQSGQDLPRYLRKFVLLGGTIPKSGKTVWSAISYEVKIALRNSFLQDLQSKFAEFISHFSSENLSEAVVAFERSQQDALHDRELYHKENLLRYLRRAQV